MGIRQIRRMALALGIMLWVFGGAGTAWGQGQKLPVAASILPLGDFCRQIGGDRVEVQVLIPPGASPHIFEPSPGKLGELTKAKVLVYIGAGMEPWLDRFIKSMPGKKPTLVEAAQGVPLIIDVPDPTGAAPPPDPHQHRKKGGHKHHHGAGNPHIWLDPVLVQDICRRLAQAFSDADPANKPVYEQNLHNYLSSLTNLHQKIEAVTKDFHIREFVGFHPSFSYFARRYQLREVGVIEVAPGREPTPHALKNIVAAIKRYGIRVIFSEPQFSPRIAEVLAREAGVSVLTLDPLGGRPPYGDNYIALMSYNLDTMAQAMR